MASARGSWKPGTLIWMPTGSPSSVRPPGSETAARSRKFAKRVKTAGLASSSCSASVAAGAAVVGEMIASTVSKTAAISRFASSRAKRVSRNAGAGRVLPASIRRRTGAPRRFGSSSTKRA